MKRKAGSIFAVLLVFAAFMVFVSEAPAPGYPDMSITKFCTNASAPGQPINFSATIQNLNGEQGLVITSCTDDPPATINQGFSITIAAGGSTTITGYYTPASSGESTDIITCTGYGTASGESVTVTRSSNPATCSSPTGEGCTRTPGYWKNHPEAWPVEEIVIGGVRYSKEDAIAIMMTSVRRDKRITMFNALVAAQLNVLSEADSSCIRATISAADAWMVANGGSPVPASSEAWGIGEPLYLMLDNYNNGLLCTPHCD
jgi:hypothetical protein